MSDLTEPQPAPVLAEQSSEVRACVQSFIEDRIEQGKEKYGVYLATWNGRNPTIDALQEAVDGLQYMVQAWMEREEMVDLLRRALEHLGGGRSIHCYEYGCGMSALHMDLVRGIEFVIRNEDRKAEAS